MWNAQHNSEKVTLRYLQPYFSIDYLFRSINPHQGVFAISNSWTVFAGRLYVRHICCYRQRTGTKCHLHALISVSVRRMTHQRSDRPVKTTLDSVQKYAITFISSLRNSRIKKKMVSIFLANLLVKVSSEGQCQKLTIDR